MGGGGGDDDQRLRLWLRVVGIPATTTKADVERAVGAAVCAPRVVMLAMDGDACAGFAWVQMGSGEERDAVLACEPAALDPAWASAVLLPP